MTMKTKLNKNARPPSAAPRYTCCVAEYYVPGLDKSEIVRVTVAVVDLRSDRLVTHREYWAEVDDLDVVVDEAGALAQRYRATLYVVSDAVPLERCCRGCDAYTVRTIKRRELAAMQRD
jgi:hypothetical protein